MTTLINTRALSLPEGRFPRSSRRPLARGEAAKPVTPWKQIRTRLFPHRGRLLAGLAIATMQSALTVPVAWLLKKAFDHAIPARDLNQLVLLGVGLWLLRLVAFILGLVANRLNLYVTRSVTVQLRKDVLDKVLSLPRSYYVQRQTANSKEVLTTETERVEQMARALLNQVLPSTILALALATVLVVLNYRMFGLMMLVWPATWLLNEYVRRRAVKVTRRYLNTFRALSAHLRWMLDSLDFVRISHAERMELQRTHQQIQASADAHEPVCRMSAEYVQLQGLLLTAVSLVVLLVGGYQVSTAVMTVGELLSFYTVVSLLNTALRDFAQGLYTVVVGAESLQEACEFLEQPGQLPYHGQLQHLLNQSLEFHQVTFGYRVEAPLLNQVDLRLRRGQVVALVGPNGSGKSTLILLLLGFERPHAGQLRADGVAYDELDIGFLRSQLGVVQQEPLLFSGSIRENLLYNRPGIPEAQIWEALSLAAAADWVRQLEEGLETPIGERGVMISGGQKQRLAIARAMLHRPPFLILDEPTNHLDARAIEQVIGNLKSMPGAPGVLLITHDESVASQAHEVYRLVDPAQKGNCQLAQTRPHENSGSLALPQSDLAPAAGGAGELARSHALAGREAGGGEPA